MVYEFKWLKDYELENFSFFQRLMHIGRSGEGHLIRRGKILLGSLVTGAITWSRWGREVSSISIQSNTDIQEPFIRLSYIRTNKTTGKRKDIDTLYYLEKFPSNLGKGFRYYFICPFTKNRCNKLYQAPHGDYFAHRNYYKLPYSRQIESKSERNEYRFISLFKKLEKYEGKYRKSFYNGEPTRRFIAQWKILRKLGDWKI